MASCIILNFVFLLVCLSLITATDIPNGIDERLDTTTVNSLIARLESLEQQTTMLTQRCKELEKQNQKLEVLLLQGTKTLSQLVLQGDSQEETLDLIEKTLMAAIPDKLQQVQASALTQHMPRNLRNSYKQETLQEFMGNRAAELVSVLSPEYPAGGVEGTGSVRVDLEYIAKALNLLSGTNQKLASKVTMGDSRNKRPLLYGECWNSTLFF